MKFIRLLVVALLFISCATVTRQTDSLVKHHPDLPRKSQINDVPFIKQAINHCGPAALAMVMRHAGHPASLEEVTKQTFTKGAKGTFQSEMISAVRRQGMMGIVINDLSSLGREIAAGRPVIVFQNLGLSFYPRWHYAVTLGYDLDGPDIILHSGKDKFTKMDMRYFERSWKLADQWGLLVLPPDQLSVTASETQHAAAAAMLEQSGKTTQAQTGYQTILKRWPHSMTALIGLGNIHFANKNYKASISNLTQASIHHPSSAVVWHNLATAQGTAGQIQKARLSAQQALLLADEKSRPAFKTSLKQWID